MNKDEKQRIRDFIDTFSSESGKRVLAHLKKFTQFDISAIPTDSMGRIDISAVMRNEGKRSVIIHIKTILAKNPYLKKQEKAKE